MSLVTFALVTQSSVTMATVVCLKSSDSSMQIGKPKHNSSNYQNNANMSNVWFYVLTTRGSKV